MTDAIEVVPEGWWQVVLAGMNLPADHPAIQKKPRMPRGEKYEGSIGAWRTARTGAKGMKAAQFDNAIRAGQRDVIEGQPSRRPKENVHLWELRCREARIAAEDRVVHWLASFGEVPILVRRFPHNWTEYGSLIHDVRQLGIELECWEFDDEILYRVRIPSAEKVAA